MKHLTDKEFIDVNKQPISAPKLSRKQWKLRKRAYYSILENDKEIKDLLNPKSIT